MKERAAFINVSQENKLSVAYDAPTRERLSAALDFLPGSCWRRSCPPGKRSCGRWPTSFPPGACPPWEGADSGVFPRP